MMCALKSHGLAPKSETLEDWGLILILNQRLISG